MGMRARTGFRMRALAALPLLLFFSAAGAGASDVDVPIKKGLSAVRDGDYPTAIAHFEKATELDPANLEALYLLAATRYAAKDFTRARRALDKLLLLDPKNARARALFASIGAIESASKSVDAEGSAEVRVAPDPDERVEAAREWTRQGAKEKAFAAWREILKFWPDHFDAHLELAKLEDRFGDPQRAIAHFDRLIKLYPARVEIYPALEAFLSRNIRAEEASRIVEQYLAWGADRPRMRRVAALTHLKAQRFDPAQLVIGEMIAADPASVDAHRLLADLQRAKGDLKRLVETLKTLKKLTHGDPEVIVELSRALEAGGVFDLALQTMGEIPPDMRDSAYFRRLVALGKRSGEKELVRGAFERILEENPGDRKLELEYVHWLRETGDPRAALDAAGRFLKRDPDSPELVKLLRDVALGAGDDVAAFAALERYVTLFPNSFASRKRLAALAKRLGKTPSVAPPDPKSTLPVFTAAEMSAECALTGERLDAVRGAIKARLDHEALGFEAARGARPELKLCNIRALERIGDEIAMARTDPEAIAGTRALMDFFLKTPADGVMIFLKVTDPAKVAALAEHPADAPRDTFRTERIVVTNEEGKPAIVREAYDPLVPPRGFTPPAKIVYDREEPVAEGVDDYDEARILERYEAYAALAGRIEAERRSILADIVERCGSRVPADIARNVAAIRFRVLAEGVKPAHLPLFERYLASSVRDELPVELLDEIERAYGLLGRIKRMADERSPDLVFALNQAKGRAEREALLAKFCKPGDPLAAFLDLSDE